MAGSSANISQIWADAAEVVAGRGRGRGRGASRGRTPPAPVIIRNSDGSFSTGKVKPTKKILIGDVLLWDLEGSPYEFRIPEHIVLSADQKTVIHIFGTLSGLETIRRPQPPSKP